MLSRHARCAAVRLEPWGPPHSSRRAQAGAVVSSHHVMRAPQNEGGKGTEPRLRSHYLCARHPEFPVTSPRTRPCDEAAIRATPVAPECLAAAKPWVLVVTILASTMAYIDESVVNVALPTIERDLAVPVAVIQWLVNAYTLSLSAFLLIGGAAGDRFGRRQVFVIGTAIFATASLWCGLAPSASQLIAARITQGVGAALLIPCSLAIIGATFDESERGRAIGTWAGFSALAAAIGPLLGGWIVDHLSWRWIFLVNPVLALPTIWIALTHVPESRDLEAK